MLLQDFFLNNHPVLKCLLYVYILSLKHKGDTIMSQSERRPWTTFSFPQCWTTHGCLTVVKRQNPSEQTQFKDTSYLYEMKTKWINKHFSLKKSTIKSVLFIYELIFIVYLPIQFSENIDVYTERVRLISEIKGGSFGPAHTRACVQVPTVSRSNTQETV